MTTLQEKITQAEQAKLSRILQDKGMFSFKKGRLEKYFKVESNNLYQPICEIKRVDGDKVHVTAFTYTPPISQYVPQTQVFTNHAIIDKDHIDCSLGIFETLHLRFHNWLNSSVDI